MHMELTLEQAEELGALLHLSLRELSHEIAKTEHPAYRAKLIRRRTALTQVLEQLSGRRAASFDDDGVEELLRELAHPGA